MITLYGPSQAPFTEKVRRALIYKNVEFELCEPQTLEDYKRWSPKTGMLPVLDLHGEHVPDSTDILLRLDVLYPEPPLLSSDANVAQQQRQLEDWADVSFLWYYMKYLHLTSRDVPLPVALDGELVDAAEERSARRPPSVWRWIRAWIRAGGTWERPLTGLLRELGDRVDDLVNFLGGRAFFYADQLSMADLAVYSMLNVMRGDVVPGSATVLAQRPTLVALMARVEAVTGG
ncbi:MAG TPA: glutathione S-transferase family protein [Myxococcota bacterium]